MGEGNTFCSQLTRKEVIMTIEKAIALGLTGEKLSREITVDELANQSFSIERIGLPRTRPMGAHHPE